MSTFNDLSLDKLGCLKDYTNDWDMDDLVEDYCSDLNKSNKRKRDKVSLPIEYKTIVLICLIYFYKKNKIPYQDELAILQQIVTDFKEEGCEYIDCEDLDHLKNYIKFPNYINNSIDNIEKLLIQYKRLPKAISDSGNQLLTPNASLTLYSGISNYKISILKNILIPALESRLGTPHPNPRSITLPTFISTSLNIDTAIRFASETTNCNNETYKPIIQFHIPKNKLHEFIWCPLFKNKILFPCRKEQSTTENEVLLPPGAVFNFSDDIPKKVVKLISGENFVIYNLVFDKYDFEIFNTDTETNIETDIETVMKADMKKIMSSLFCLKCSNKKQRTDDMGRGIHFTKKMRQQILRRRRRLRRRKTKKRQGRRQRKIKKTKRQKDKKDNKDKKRQKR